MTPTTVEADPVVNLADRYFANLAFVDFTDTPDGNVDDLMAEMVHPLENELKDVTPTTREGVLRVLAIACHELNLDGAGDRLACRMVMSAQRALMAGVA